MKKSQNNKLTSQIASCVVLAENEAKVATFTAYPEVKALIDQGIAAEQSLASNQEMRLRNSTAARDQVKGTACEFVLDLSRKVKALAVVKGNKTLLDQVSFTASKLKRTPDNKLVRIFDSVLTFAEENLEGTLEYGVSEQLLTAGKALLVNLKAEIENLLLSRLEQKQFTAQLRQQFRTTEEAFKTLDALVETLRLSEPVFHSLFRSARICDNQSYTRYSVIGKAYDAATGQPLHKASISIRNAESVKSLSSGADLVKNVKFTGEQGGFRYKSLATGSYIVTVSYAGYADQEVILHINEGVLGHIEIPMLKSNPETFN